MAGVRVTISPSALTDRWRRVLIVISCPFSMRISVHSPVRPLRSAGSSRNSPEDAFDLQAVDIEAAVVDRGVLTHRHAAAVMAAVANREMDGARHGALVTDRDAGVEGAEPAEHTQPGDRIAEAAPTVASRRG